MNRADEEDKVAGLWWSVAAAALFVLGMIWWGYRTAWPATGAPAFGDLFQAIAALFSGLAFIGVVAAIFLQRHELRLQRYELQQTRQVLDEQRKQLEAQERTMRKQVFETTFFALVRRFRELAESASTELAPGNVLQNVQFWKWMIEQMFPIPKTGGSDPLHPAYTRLREEHRHVFDPYFSTLTEILKFLDNSEFAAEPRQIYSRLLRAQITTDELVLLALEGQAGGIGSKGLKELVERFGMLRNVPVLGSKSERPMAAYADGAYKD